MYIVFIGPPGSGKGTQSQRLSEHLGIPHLSTGEMFRQAKQDDTSVGRAAASFIDAGRLVPDEVVIMLVEEQLDRPECSRGCLFDGFPRTMPQGCSLDKAFEKRGLSLDHVVELRVDEAELERRILKRAEIERRPDDTRETIRRRLEIYHQETVALLDYYREKGLLVSVDGEGTPEEVFAGIRAALQK